MSSVAARVLAAVGPAFRSRAGALLTPLTEALSTPAQDLADLVEPAPGRNYARIFDLDHTPAPGWLGTVTGTPVPTGIDVERARTYVRDRPTWKRGHHTTMLAAIRATYPTGRVDILERAGSPWRTLVRLYAAEATEEDRLRVHDAALTQKPTGIRLTTEIATGASYAHMQAVHGPTFADEAGDFPTFADAIAHVPEEGTIP